MQNLDEQNCVYALTIRQISLGTSDPQKLQFRVRDRVVLASPKP